MHVDSQDDIIYTCPIHGCALTYSASHEKNSLICPQNCEFSVQDNIPRFVSIDNYASSFGLQWNTFKKTQLDSYTQTTISRDRLTRIMDGLEWLQGKTVLEAGCGAGRFSEIFLQAGAELYSLDLSSAVDAARENCKHFSNHHICQASILAMPFSAESFDIVVCIGVVQHTPDPEETIAALAQMVKPGGKLFIDHYTSDYPMSAVRQALRRFLLRKNPEYCMRFCQYLRNILWPLHTALHRYKASPVVGRIYAKLLQFSPLVDYQDSYPQLAPEILREWALLDMHDLLTDVYKHLRTTEQINNALTRSGLEVIKCVYAGNGVEAAAIKPANNTGV